MLILALDASTKHVGYTVATDKCLQECGEYKPQGLTAFDKIHDFMLWLNGIIQHRNIDAVFYEIPRGNHRNPDTHKILGSLEFGAWLTCTNSNTEFLQVSPSQVKATGVYKVLNKDRTINTDRYKLACEYWSEFLLITKHDGSINKAAMERQDDIVDSIGTWLAGLKELGYE